ncbi:MAG: hypothetical protein EXS25_06180 [Pedosphaera sp.]|nr:hypothetical protein [Pedosphaera sp.]
MSDIHTIADLREYLLKWHERESREISNPLPKPLATKVVVAIRGDLFFGDDLGGGREGEEGLGGRFGAQGLEVGGEFDLDLLIYKLFAIDTCWVVTPPQLLHDLSSSLYAYYFVPAGQGIRTFGLGYSSTAPIEYPTE